MDQVCLISFIRTVLLDAGLRIFGKLIIIAHWKNILLGFVYANDCTTQTPL